MKGSNKGFTDNQFVKGYIPWNKGKPVIKEVAERIGATLRGRKHPPNCGHCIAAKNHKLSVEHKRKLNEGRMLFRLPTHGTSIEKLTEAYLRSKHVVFQNQFLITFASNFWHRIDHFIPNLYEYGKHLAVEDDGAYWHSRPGAKGRDFAIDRCLNAMGIEVLRLTEEEINSGDFSRLESKLNGR